jgi:hypothetical protein
MGEDGETYILYSSNITNNDIKLTLDINAVFKQALHPSRYPQYTNPGFMDMIMIQYGLHQFSYSTMSDRPIINGQSIQCPEVGTTYLHLSEPEVHVYVLANHILSLNMGAFLGSSYEYAVNVSLHNDEWMVHYMNIEMSVSPASSISTGLLGQTRSSTNIVSSAGVLGTDLSLDFVVNSGYWQSIVDQNPQKYLVKNDEIERK